MNWNGSIEEKHVFDSINFPKFGKLTQIWGDFFNNGSLPQIWGNSPDLGGKLLLLILGLISMQVKTQSDQI